MAEQTGTRTLATTKTQTVDLVSKSIQQYMERGEINLPSSYSPQNALKSAWLTLQTVTTGKNDGSKPVLVACSQRSIMNALFDMVVQGLNPAKKQCYFIAYGTEVTCMRSYFGTMAVAMLVDPEIEDIVAEVVYAGDVFKYRIERGRKIITVHEQSIENVDKAKLVATYCVIYRHDGRVETTIKTFDEIKQAWHQSKQKPFTDKGEISGDSVHGKFTADMAKRTVINAACKPIINRSDDASLLGAAIHRSDEIEVDHEVAESIRENANAEMIDIKSEDPVDKSTALGEGSGVEHPEMAEDREPVTAPVGGPGF